MQNTKDKIEQIILSCFNSPKYSQQQSTDTHFIIHMCLNADKIDFPIKITMPNETLKNYSNTPELSKTKFENRLKEKIMGHLAKFNGKKVIWVINLHVPQ